MSELETEVAALRWFITCMAAEIISLHSAPVKKLSDLKAEVEAMSIESVKRLDQPRGQQMFDLCVQLGLLLDDTEEHFSDTSPRS